MIPILMFIADLNFLVPNGRASASPSNSIKLVANEPSN